jgi:hypothetical protein
MVDCYVRRKHACFLAEFFATRRGGESYLCCFRPLGTEEDSVDRYACRYVTIAATEIQRIVLQPSLPDSTMHLLDTELSGLRE